MKKIPVKSSGGAVCVALIDSEDREKVENFRWYAALGYAYTTRHVDGRPLAMHHLILGRPKSGLVVDHKNGDKLDNRKENLRFCTRAENNRNSPVSPKNKIGLKGVSLDWGDPNRKKPWRADIKVQGKRVFVGYFLTPELAHEAYKQAAIKYHGDFARFN